MIYPILAYGDNILRKEAEDYPRDSEDLTQLVENMYETMYNANGVGLAAPQIGLSYRIFVIDSTQMGDEEEGTGIKRAFINPEILDEYGNEWAFEEDGVLFTDYIKGLKKQMMRAKLVNISKGNVDIKYRMKFPLKK